MASTSQAEAPESHPIETPADPAAALEEATADVKEAPKAKAKSNPRAEAKAARAAQRGKAAAEAAKKEEDDPLQDRYGDLQLVQSREQTQRTWRTITTCTPDREGQEVLLRGRVHSVRGKGKSFFLVLRQQMCTIQTLGFANNETVSKGMVKYASDLPRESVVDISGKVVVPKEPITGCSQSQVEIHITAIHCVSRAQPLPFEVIDASRSAAQLESDDQYVTVNQDVRLNHRVLDLRTPSSQAIFRLQSDTCTLFRETLLLQGFQEIHSPKLIGGASEGGAAVFTLQYFGQDACLAQSPQFYKQMALAADMGRVFEITPVFRAEQSFTHRHMCEFTGLDFEMEIHEHYFEVLDVVDRLFVAIFKGLQVRYEEELAAIAEQYPFEPLQWLPETLRLEYAEGIRMLQESGREVDPMGDLGTEDERVLGRLVKEKYHTDFYILYRYPLAVRPFYTMPDPEDPQLSCSYDVFIRGEEIISGAQRVHDPVLLAERATVHGIELDTISGYLDSFKYGMPPHGGCGVGLERVVMLFCGLDNIRKTSLFPRDPKRLSP